MVETKPSPPTTVASLETARKKRNDESSGDSRHGGHERQGGYSIHCMMSEGPNGTVCGDSQVGEDSGVKEEQKLGIETVAGLDAEAEDAEQWQSVVVGGSLIPPTNFGMIEEDMYRSGMANELNFPFLEKLQLKTILYLASEDLSEKLDDFIDDQGIDLLQLAPEEEDLPAPWKPMSEEVVLTAMNYLLDPTMYPIHVMCSQGRHRTGTVIGCLRKLQRWSLSSIFEEYHRYADGRGRLANEQFIELFDTDLISLPSQNRPRWLH